MELRLMFPEILALGRRAHPGCRREHKTLRKVPLCMMEISGKRKLCVPRPFTSIITAAHGLLRQSFAQPRLHSTSCLLVLGPNALF